ncbi:hypothetical protein Lesp02_10850 [Lentzea sp. NBRC 105346]|uniref:DUF6492 family protein n=1 Tax=Lentzea sp. NBRC 105346 TaxID=3032205 RepID=UPI0024A1A946|nr:DUF6492 family protein [Lentzea sp. NBRC 105346]GLZ28895.1 hypothetical protein Lesp02_10850 [Lentzea sp. NBRC 105346]
MTELAVITPSFAPDAELFAELHRSVLEHTSDDTIHHVVVPAAHRSIFEKYANRRLRIWTHPQLVPRRYVRLPAPGGVWINRMRPWPPIRGWVMQQAVKIAAAAMVEADAVMIADSDVVLVRPTGLRNFSSDGRLCLYRDENAVHEGLDRHILWHQVARELLGLPDAPPPPLPDYVSPLNFWDPSVVRKMQERIADVTGMHWMDAFNRRLHVSEFIIYGVFVDEVLDASARPPSNTTICHNSWERVPMSRDEAVAFGDRIHSDAIAMMISSHSGTPMDVRLTAEQHCIGA